MSQGDRIEHRGAKRRLGFKLAALSLAVLVAFACGEVAARIVHPEEPGQLANTDSEDVTKGKRLKPGFDPRTGVNVDKLGYRDDEDFPLAKPAGEKRILFVGDSFLYAAFLKEEEVLPWQCAKRLGANVRPIDIACPGWGTRHEKFAYDIGEETHPDVVVLCFFVGNDVCETFQAEQPSSGDEHAVIGLGANGQLEVRHRRTRLHMRLLRCSKLFRLWESTALYQRLAHHHEAAPNPGTKGSTLVEDAYWKIELLRISQFRKGASDRPPLDEAWRLVAKNFFELVAAVRAAGEKLAVIVIPDEIQVDARKRAEVCRRFNLDEKDFDLDEFQRRVAALCAGQEVPCVDVLPAFRAQGAQGGLYLDLDTHWNAKGHALAASLLAPTLAELLK